MILDTNLKLQSMEEAVKIYDAIRSALSNPEKKIEGESLTIYKELDSWQFLEHYPIQDNKNQWLYTSMIALQRYRHLKWEKEHPHKNTVKKSKWEVVHGTIKNPKKINI